MSSRAGTAPQPNDEHTFYVRGDIAGYTESVHKNFLLFTNMPDPVPDPSDANGFLTTTTPAITLTDERETHRNQIYVVGGRDQFGRLAVDWHAAYSRATFDQDRNIGAEFDGPTVPITYDNVTTPNYPIFTFPSGFNVNDASQYVLNTTSNPLGDSVVLSADHELSYAMNASYPVGLSGGDDHVKVGWEVRLREKDNEEWDFIFTVPPISSFSCPTPGTVLGSRPTARSSTRTSSNTRRPNR